MLIDISYPKQFQNLWSKLKKKYPQELFNLDGVGEQLDINKFSKMFFTNKTTTADVSVDSNANVSDKSVNAFPSEMAKPFEKLDSYYMLWKYANEIFGLRTSNEMVEAQLNGAIYINDFHGLSAGKPYCFNYSTYDIATKGLPMIDKIKSLPPKYLYAFKSQVEQFVTIASNSTLGATGLADLLLVMSFYVEDILENRGDAHFKFASEEDCWIYVRENLVSMIYTLNQPMRATQSPFTNVSLYDEVFLKKLSQDYIHPRKGTPLNVEIVKKLQEIYIDVMNAELERTPITFPVTSACFTRDNNYNIKDEEFLDFIAKKSLKFGFMNFYIGKSSTISSCCRLRSDLENDYFNSFGAGSSKIGSLGVVTINFPRLAFKYTRYKDGELVFVDHDGFMRELKHLAELCFKINYVKRNIIQDRINNGYHPLYSLGFIELDKQYLTLGVNGFNEAIELMGYDPLSEDGVQFGLKIIKALNLTNNRMGRKFKVPVNIEQIPAENTSIKLANKDRVLGYNFKYKIYSNQFIPLTTGADMLDRIKLQGIYDEHFSGGSICHLNVEQRIEDPEQIKDLIRVAAKKGCVYLAINYNLQECTNSHLTVGRNVKCPVCSAPIIDNYTRVVGFLTAVRHWHRTRREVDYPNRVFY